MEDNGQEILNEQERFEARQLAIDVQAIIERFSQPLNEDELRFYPEIEKRFNPHKSPFSKITERAFKEVKGVRLQHRDNSDLQLELLFAPSVIANRERIGEFANAPDNFDFPAVSLYPYSNAIVDVDTPYGPHPNLVISRGGDLWYFSNVYFMNMLGKAVRYEEVHRVGNIKEREIQDTYSEELGEIPRVFSLKPRKQSSRYVPLNREGLQKVRSYVQQIQTGLYIPKK